MKIDGGYVNTISMNIGDTPNISSATEFNGNNDKSTEKAKGFGTALQKAMDNNQEKELKKSCQEFEGMFLNIVYKQMKSTIMKSSLMPESTAKEMFESMLDDKLTEESSKAGGIGLGEILFKQLRKEMINKYKPV